MPNWCENILIITSHDVDALNKFYLDNKTEENELDFNCICPIPSELQSTSSPNKDNEAIQKELIDKYGHADWYSWSCSNWGTKWNAGEVDFDNTGTQLSYTFQTAWNPPNAWFSKLIEKYSEFDFNLEFEEPGMDYGGYINYTDQILSEETYSLGTHIWENCDQDMVHNTIVEVIEENIDEQPDIDELTDLTMEILIDDINNAYSMYETINHLISEYIENRENNNDNNTTYQESIFVYDDQGQQIQDLSL